MSLNLTNDPRFIGPNEMDMTRERALRRGTFDGEAVMHLVEYIELQEAWSSMGWRRVRELGHEVARLEDIINDNGLSTEPPDIGDEYEDAPPLSARSVELINMGVNV